jgi:hypothetical protein
MDPQPGGQTAADFPLTDPTAARLTGPDELVVAVPALIGFRPRDSLVAVGVRSPDSTVVCTLRVDLADVAGSVAARRHIARVLANQGCDELFLVVVGGRRSRQGPPRRRLVCALRDECATIGLPVRAAVWAAEVALGARWACYGECGCDGALPDPACSSVTAATVASGRVVYGDRAELERLVAPGDARASARRASLLERRLNEAERIGKPPADASACAALVERWLGEAAAGPPRLADDDVVALCLALADPVIRDFALGFALGPRAAAAERLWLALVTAAPDPEAAEAAVLLAHCALMRGDGALACVALRRAQQAWPGHRLSTLFQAALDSGANPAELRAWFLDGRHPVERLPRSGGS